MIYFGWILRNVSDAEKAELQPQIVGLLCKQFNLCASIGCACLTGTGDVQCSETSAGTQFPHIYGDGPSWSIHVTSLEQSLRIDVHLSGPVLSSEMGEFYAALREFDKPIYTLHGCGLDNL